MNLYEIQFEHSAPKDQKIGTVCFLLAPDVDLVYEWVKSKPTTKYHTIYNSWAVEEEKKEEFKIYDREYNITGMESFKEKMIRLEGQIDDGDNDYSDAYYGITLYGWVLISGNVNDDLYETLKNNGIDVYIVGA